MPLYCPSAVFERLWPGAGGSIIALVLAAHPKGWNASGFPVAISLRRILCILQLWRIERSIG